MGTTKIEVQKLAKTYKIDVSKMSWPQMRSAVSSETKRLAQDKKNVAEMKTRKEELEKKVRALVNEAVGLRIKVGKKWDITQLTVAINSKKLKIREAQDKVDAKRAAAGILKKIKALLPLISVEVKDGKYGLFNKVTSREIFTDVYVSNKDFYTLIDHIYKNDYGSCLDMGILKRTGEIQNEIARLASAAWIKKHSKSK